MSATTYSLAPKISVLMSVYNGSRYLKESVDSILNQSFTDFELIIIDDCSTDNTWEILTKYAAQDQRIRLFKNQKKLWFNEISQLWIETCKRRMYRTTRC